MEFRTLGRTGEKISTIGMGTWRIGVYGGPEERDRQIRALRRGIELGINLIDTAEMYADGRSEELVGEAVGEARNKVFIATKVSPGNLRRDSVINACQRSLKRLGTSYIDLYQVHWPNPRIQISETMAAMEDLVHEGKVRYIGVSNFDIQQTNEAREALRKSELASNQVEYSLRNPGVESDILPYCEDEKITLIAYSPLAKGNIPQSMIPQALQTKYKMTPAQLMLNWVTRSDRVVAIPKSSNIKHMEENASSVSVRLTEEEYRSFGDV